MSVNQKILIKEVIIHWAEGDVFTGENVSFNSVDAANLIINAIAEAAYQANCFDTYKMLYTVSWVDGETITKRMEITQDMRLEEKVIGKDIKFTISFHSGIKPAYMTDEVYMQTLDYDGVTTAIQKKAKFILENYSFE